MVSKMIPLAGISSLTKDFITVRGRDATKFLNGLVTSRLLADVKKKKQHTIDINKHQDLSQVIDPETNWGLMHEDIYDPDETILVRRDGIFSMFLNSKGRVFSDCFLYSNPFHNFNGLHDEKLSEPNYTIEIDPKYTRSLLSLLKLHKLSAKVKIKQDKNLHSYYYYNDSPKFDGWVDELQARYLSTSTPTEALNYSNQFMEDETMFNKSFAKHIIGFGIDNRIPNFGVKILTQKPLDAFDSKGEDTVDSRDLWSDSFKELFETEDINEEDVKRRRVLNGLFETQDAPPDTSLLPFEVNLDYVNGLSLDKGCYVGQELTIRTFNNGIIRKRVTPVQFFELNEDSMESINSEERINFNLEDDVLLSLRHLNRVTLSKIEISPLIETEKNHENSTGESPFGESPFNKTLTKNKRRTSSGKLLSVQDNLGFVLMNLKDLSNTNLFKMELPCLENNGVKPIGLKVTIPEWWPES